MTVIIFPSSLFDIQFPLKKEIQFPELKISKPHTNLLNFSTLHGNSYGTMKKSDVNGHHRQSKRLSTSNLPLTSPLTAAPAPSSEMPRKSKRIMQATPQSTFSVPPSSSSEQPRKSKRFQAVNFQPPPNGEMHPYAPRSRPQSGPPPSPPPAAKKPNPRETEKEM